MLNAWIPDLLQGLHLPSGNMAGERSGWLSSQPLWHVCSSVVVTCLPELTFSTGTGGQTPRGDRLANLGRGPVTLQYSPMDLDKVQQILPIGKIGLPPASNTYRSYLFHFTGPERDPRTPAGAQYLQGSRRWSDRQDPKIPLDQPGSGRI